VISICLFYCDICDIRNLTGYSVNAFRRLLNIVALVRLTYVLYVLNFLSLLLHPGKDASYCNQGVYLSVCQLACFKNHMSKFYFFCIRYLSPWLGPPLTVMQYVIHFRFCG